MELIKKIKQTEAQAQEIIEHAKAEAAAHAEEGRKNRRQILERAEQERKKTIEAVAAEAESQGLAQVRQLKDQAQKDRRLLHDNVRDEITPAVAKVMDHLGSHFDKRPQNAPALRG